MVAPPFTIATPKDQEGESSLKDFYLRLTPLYHRDGVLDLVVCALDKGDAITQAREQDPFDGGNISIRSITACQHRKGVIV